MPNILSKIELPNGTVCDIKSYKTMSIPMGSVDSTSTSTAFTATIDGISELIDGVCVWLTNGIVTSAAGYTININGLGAKPVYRSNAAETASSTQFNVAYTVLLIYNSSRVSGGCWDYVYGYDADTTYTFDGTYNASTNKAATVSTVTNAVNALDVTGDSNIAASKTIKSWSETNGKVSVTTQDISITKSQVSDFPTLGTASAKDVPTSGNASTTQVVMGNDSRLSDSRTPTAHNQASNTINAMTGYTAPTNPTTWQTVSASDSLNTATQKIVNNVEVNKNNISYNTNNGVKNLANTNTLGNSSDSGVKFSSANGVVSCVGTKLIADSYCQISFDKSKIKANTDYVLAVFDSVGNPALTFWVGWRHSSSGNYSTKETYNTTVFNIGAATSDILLRVYARGNGGTQYNASAKFMLCEKTIWDSDNTYQSYALSNAELTVKERVNENNISFIANNNVKNLLNLTITSNTFAGVTYTNNRDGTITLESGTASIAPTILVLGSVNAKVGTYKLTGCPATGSDDSYRLDVRLEGQAIGGEYGDGVTINIPTDSTIFICIRIQQNYTVNNLLFRPMFRRIGDDTFVPYAFTNSELTTNILFNTNEGFLRKNLSPWSGGTASADNTYLMQNEPITLPAGTYLVSYLTTATSGRAEVQFRNDSTSVGSVTLNHQSGRVSGTVTLTSAATNMLMFTMRACTVSEFMVSSTTMDATYQPYALSNTTITPALKECVDNGKKQLLRFYSDTNGALVATAQSNGYSVRITGGDDNVGKTVTYADCTIDKTGAYTFSCNLTGTGASCYIYDATTGTQIREYYATSSEALTLTGGHTYQVRTYRKGSGTNATVAVMICESALYAISSDMRPCATTNAELTSGVLLSLIMPFATNNYNVSNLSVKANATIDTSTGIITQTTTDTQTNLRFQMSAFNGNTLVRYLTDNIIMTNNGVYYLTFTKSSNYNTLVFGHNGSAADFKVALPVSALSNGDYIFKINILNCIQANGAYSFNDIAIVKKTGAYIV